MHIVYYNNNKIASHNRVFAKGGAAFWTAIHKSSASACYGKFATKRPLANRRRNSYYNKARKISILKWLWNLWLYK